jgi:hypothetical protein
MIDAGIYQGLKQYEAPDMMGMAGKAMTLQQMAMQNRKLQSDADEDAAIKSAFAQNIGADGKINQAGALSAIGKVSPTKALQYQEQFTKNAAAQAENFLKVRAAALPTMEHLAGLKEEERAAAYPAAMAYLEKNGVPMDRVPKDPETGLAIYDPGHFAQSYGTLKNTPEYLDQMLKKANINNLNAQAEKNRRERSSPEATFKKLPKEKQDQIEGVGKKQANLIAINNEIKSAFEQLSDPALSEDDKIKVGEGLLKTLNSTQGSDAVGAEEANRLGSYLKYKLANFTEPGAFVGRDLDQFTRQVGLVSNKLDAAYQKNDEAIKNMYAGGSGQSPALTLPADDHSSWASKIGVGGVKKAVASGDAPALPPVPKGMVRMKSPSGAYKLVSESQVVEAIAAGGERVK